MALYTATDRVNWLDNTNWLQVDGGVTPCNWSGVTCADGHVTGLELPRNGLTGSVPAALADLGRAPGGRLGRQPAGRGHRPHCLPPGGHGDRVRHRL
ncbi:MAG: hypothetical protein R2854_29335 [Caldilineaceae bacterium]